MIKLLFVSALYIKTAAVDNAIGFLCRFTITVPDKKFYKVPGEIKIMVFDILGGSLLLAVGILAIYFSVESKVQDTEFLVMFLLGFVAAIAGGWILITRLTIAVILTKLAGLILIIIGVFLTFEFPDIDQYQRTGMSKTGILLGLFLLILGIYLFVFAYTILHLMDLI